MAKSFPEILASEKKPILIPGVFDGLSTRLAEQAGFSTLFVGGFPTVGARFGVPDIGLRAMSDVAATVSEIIQITDLPVFVDIDDGYGDVKNAVNTLHVYEKIGAAAVQIEDQTWPKRCGHMEGKSVVPAEDAVAKVRAVAAERMNPNTIISARTDAREYRISGEVMNLIPLRNRRTAPDGERLQTRISEGMTRWQVEEVGTGYGLSEYLDQIVGGVPVGFGEEDGA